MSHSFIVDVLLFYPRSTCHIFCIFCRTQHYGVTGLSYHKKRYLSRNEFTILDLLFLSITTFYFFTANFYLSRQFDNKNSSEPLCQRNIKLSSFLWNYFYSIQKSNTHWQCCRNENSIFRYNRFCQLLTNFLHNCKLLENKIELMYKSISWF